MFEPKLNDPRASRSAADAPPQPAQSVSTTLSNLGSVSLDLAQMTARIADKIGGAVPECVPSGRIEKAEADTIVEALERIARNVDAAMYNMNRAYRYLEG